MFWGDNNLSRDISLQGVQSGGKLVGRNRSRRAYLSASHQPMLKIGVTSLPPGVSRSVSFPLSLPHS
jgi:hypothetical protein